MKAQLIALSLLCMAASAVAQKQLTLASPDGALTANISLGSTLTYEVALGGKTVVSPSAATMTLSTGEVWGAKPKLRSAKRQTVNRTIASPLYHTASLKDNYNALTLALGKDYSVEFRAYNDGIAYRFATTRRKPFNVVSEGVAYNFPQDATLTAAYVRRGTDGDWKSQFANSFENTYTVAPVSQFNTKRLMFLPVVADEGDAKVCLTEVNLESYPGLYLKAGGSTSLTGVNAPCPKDVTQESHNMRQTIVVTTEDFIARVGGPRAFPWRVAIVGKDDKSIAASTLSYQLADPSRVADISWVKPGKVVWDWWNDWNIEGVDFRAGINTETYKYYIDFAASKGIEYIILDEGWAVNLKADLMQIVPEVDMRQIVDYGKSKNVGVILWTGFYAFDRDMENVCRHYSEMGVKGFKVDFMDRDDQQLTDFIYRAAETAARYHLVIDFHGMYKPAGLNRTYPNVLNFEGVYGLEQMKWSPATVDQLQYDATIPFVRQVAGPMDYTQGAMRNGGVNNYHPFRSEPMSQGTRCHQLGLYVVLESPLNMLCDAPSNYLRETECTDFIAAIPTVWDETRILDGKMGEYIVTARRSGSVWYVGGITNRTPRDIDVSLPFITGTYKCQLFKDGINADRKATDYKQSALTVSPGQTIKLHLAPGGGFAMRLAQ